MSTAITKALSEVQFGIPLEILQLAFRENSAKVNTAYSLEEIITNRVIRPRVLVDANIVGGIQTTIPLSECLIEYVDNYEAIITVPKSSTNNKAIITALNIVSNMRGNVATGITGGPSSLLDAAAGMMDGLDNLDIVQTSRLEVIAENIILVQEFNLPITTGMIRVVVENDTNLNNISPRSYISFSKLVVLAVKAYIYNIMVVRLDKGYLYSGHDLGVIKDIIDGYSDANEMYLEYLEGKWKKVAFMNDDVSKDRFIKSMLGRIM